MSPRARILLFTGDGKGKTTAAMGMVMRAAGHGIPVFVIQFIKHEETGEIPAAQLLPNVEIAQTGLGFLPQAGDERWPAHKEAAEKALRRAGQALASGAYPMVVLDECVYAVARELLREEDVLALLHAARPETTIILTGRGATEGLMAAADTVTEMRCVKHGLSRGYTAQKGVEF